MSETPEPAADNDAARARPVSRAAVPDEGLASWGGILLHALSMQSGVEIIGTGGGTVGFRFRGQTFSVTITRIG